jgi:hypothetical protein
METTLHRKVLQKAIKMQNFEILYDLWIHAPTTSDIEPFEDNWKDLLKVTFKDYSNPFKQPIISMHVPQIKINNFLAMTMLHGKFIMDKKICPFHKFSFKGVLLIEHIDFSWISMCIFRWKCEVLPPIKIRAAIPEEVTQITIFPWVQSAQQSVL